MINLEQKPAGRIPAMSPNLAGCGLDRQTSVALREQYGHISSSLSGHHWNLIGGYEPRWMMRDQHLEPAEAVQAFLDSGADVALAHHFGTFPLTDEDIDAPPLALAQALSAAGIAPERFRTLQPGQVWQSD